MVHSQITLGLLKTLLNSPGHAGESDKGFQRWWFTGIRNKVRVSGYSTSDWLSNNQPHTTIWLTAIKRIRHKIPKGDDVFGYDFLQHCKRQLRLCPERKVTLALSAAKELPAKLPDITITTKAAKNKRAANPLVIRPSPFNTIRYLLCAQKSYSKVSA